MSGPAFGCAAYCADQFPPHPDPVDIRQNRVNFNARESYSNNLRKLLLLGYLLFGLFKRSFDVHHIVSININLLRLSSDAQAVGCRFPMTTHYLTVVVVCSRAGVAIAVYLSGKRAGRAGVCHDWVTNYFAWFPVLCECPILQRAGILLWASVWLPNYQFTLIRRDCQPLTAPINESMVMLYSAQSNANDQQSQGFCGKTSHRHSLYVRSGHKNPRIHSSQAFQKSSQLSFKANTRADLQEIQSSAR